MGYAAPKGRLLGCFVVCLSLAMLATPASADVVSYLTEGSPVAGPVDFDYDISAPSPWAGSVIQTSNSLAIHPTNYAVTSAAGVPSVAFLMNQMLPIMITAPAGYTVSTITVFEDGGFSLRDFGTTGTDMTQVSVTTSLYATAEADDDTVVLVPQTMMFSTNPVGPFNEAGDYNLVDDATMTGRWYGELTWNIAAAQPNATSVLLSVGNSLVAVSQATTLASISKAQFRVEIGLVVVPEPSTVCLLFAGCLAFLIRRRS